MIRFQRLKAGEYKSADGRILINRMVSRQTYYANEIVWVLTIDGKERTRCYNTLKEAIETVQEKVK